MSNSLNGKTSVCILRSNPVRPDSRVEKEAWSLKRMGYNVHVLAWDRDSVINEKRDNITVSDDDIPITRLGYKASFGEGFKNIIPYLKFQLHMRSWLKKHKFDVIHACDFDTAFFSYGIARRNKSKFVFDIFDFLYGEPQSIMQKCVKKAQFYLIKHANATIICTEDRKRQISGSQPRQLAVIHNTPSLSQIKDFDSFVDNNHKIKVAYVGILQDFRLLKELSEAISEMENVELHIGGFGKYEAYFTELSKKCDNIKFYGRLGYEHTLALEQSCDIMLAIYDPSIENHRFAAPNKFYESLMLGKPVIMVKGTGMSQIVEEQKIGTLIEYSKDGFISGLKDLIEQKNLWNEMGQRMKALYESDYSWDRMYKRLDALYQNLND